MNGLQNKAILIIGLLILFLNLNVRAQENFRIMFYNVENLYDTKDNPKANDDDLTPQGQLRWTSFRYRKKINDIAKVIYAVGENKPPALVGMCEIETDSVLYDLTNKTALKKDKYRHIITNSKDSRGSNVALLYQRDQIRIIDKKEYTPFIEVNFTKTTRNMLHVVGRVISGDTLDIFVCHFPSRNEGIKKTQPYRIKCAQLLKLKTDSVVHIRKKANIIIMGDFNDYPTDISLKSVLEAKSIDSEIIYPKSLYNMFYNDAKERDSGTYKYRGKWNFIDQFIVNGNLLNHKNRVKVKNKKAHVFFGDFLLENDTKYGGKKPFRTYSGFKYLGGTSDHLPIYFDILIKK